MKCVYTFVYKKEICIHLIFHWLLFLFSFLLNKIDRYIYISFFYSFEKAFPLLDYAEKIKINCGKIYEF